VNIKINDFLENVLENTFYVYCYILLSGTRPKRRCRTISGAAMLY